MSADARRYRLGQMGEMGMVNDDDGPWVHWSDFKKLRDQLEAGGMTEGERLISLMHDDDASPRTLDLAVAVVEQVLEAHEKLNEVGEQVAKFNKWTVERDQEIEQLRAALWWCTESVWDGHDIDGGEFQGQMVERGLMVIVPADEEFKSQYDATEMYAWNWGSAAKEARDD